MKRILFAFPTLWDAPQLDACRAAWEGRFEPRLAEPTDDSCSWQDDALQIMEALIARHGGAIDGVVSSSDYPGATIAAAMARRLRLPGPAPETVIGCSHKWYSRLAQRESAPEATPRFALIDPRAADPAEGAFFPCFVKPVKGAFSIMSRRIDSARELREFCARPAMDHFLDVWVAMFDRMVTALTPAKIGGRRFLAEELLHGNLVTVEGWSLRGEVEIFGIVDSHVHPETGSFTRFVYPSALPEAVQARMAAIARRVVAHVGLEPALFNVEMIHDPGSDRISIIEINPRIAGQFGDLHAKVDGASSYEHALSIAAGERPRTRRREGPFAVACSEPQRVFRPVRVVAAPDDDARRAAESLREGTLVWTAARAGAELSDFERFEDGFSHRYAVVNCGARDAADLDATLAAIRERLGFRFEELRA
jgi:biotin carboxylase